MRCDQAGGHGVARPFGPADIACATNDSVRGERIGDEFGNFEVQGAATEQHDESDLT
jgi:hypothetical protein